jgi:hypothetical protein
MRHSSIKARVSRRWSGVQILRVDRPRYVIHYLARAHLGDWLNYFGRYSSQALKWSGSTQRHTAQPESDPIGPTPNALLRLAAL